MRTALMFAALACWTFGSARAAEEQPVALSSDTITISYFSTYMGTRGNLLGGVELVLEQTTSYVSLDKAEFLPAYASDNAFLLGVSSADLYSDLNNRAHFSYAGRRNKSNFHTGRYFGAATMDRNRPNGENFQGG